MKKYQAQFELKDRMSQSKASKEMVEKRRKMKADFDSWKATAKQEYEANKVSTVVRGISIIQWGADVCLACSYQERLFELEFG